MILRPKSIALFLIAFVKTVVGAVREFFGRALPVYTKEASPILISFEAEKGLPVFCVLTGVL